MLSARERAHALRAAHGLDGAPTDRQLDAILASTGLAVEADWPFTGRVREVYAAGRLGIRADLSRDWVRWLKGHGLGHHLLHSGNHLYVRDGLYLWQRQELEAELFAGTLLLAGAAVSCRSLDELARRAEVPLSCVHTWQAASLLAEELARAKPIGYDRDADGGTDER
jgi:hypothetical protein